MPETLVGGGRFWINLGGAYTRTFNRYLGVLAFLAVWPLTALSRDEVRPARNGNSRNRLPSGERASHGKVVLKIIRISENEVDRRNGLNKPEGESRKFLYKSAIRS